MALPCIFCADKIVWYIHDIGYFVHISYLRVYKVFIFFGGGGGGVYLLPIRLYNPNLLNQPFS